MPNFDAVFSDETYNFVIPAEPSSSEPVTIKLRTMTNNFDSVYLTYRKVNHKMKKACTENNFDYFEITLDSVPSALSYFFTLRTKTYETYFYNRRGTSGQVDENFNFKIIPDFKTPKWARGAVMYQIYVDRFFDSDKTNNVVNNEYAYLGTAAKGVEMWDRPLQNLDVCDFYGGDLQGIIDKMDYLKELGVEAVYLNPIFVSPSNHKYDTQDYDYVDPHIGVILEDGGQQLFFENFHNNFATKYIKRTTDIRNLEASNELFCKLTKVLHENGIKVILDGVFNHCGAFHKWLDKEGFYSKAGYPKGAFTMEDSIYHSYFKWHDRTWPGNESYDSWWGFSNHPKLNFEESEKLYNYVLEVGKKWVSNPFGADGWRLDVAADLGYSKEFNIKFWQDFRSAVKGANPDAIILAEHYGSPEDWLSGNEWDTVMNYDAFMEPITWFLTGINKHSEVFKPDMLNNAQVFKDTMDYYMSRFSIQSCLTAMNQLSNHDHSRFLTRTNRTVGRLHTMGHAAAGHNINKNVFMSAVVFQMTWPGSPTIYYGDEAGLVGWSDPDNRRTYPWGKEDKTLIDFHKKAISLRKDLSCIKEGSTIYLLLDYGVLSYGRFDKENSVAVIINNNHESKTLKIPVWKLGIAKNGIMRIVLTTGNNSFSTEFKDLRYRDGFLEITVNGYSSVVMSKV